MLNLMIMAGSGPEILGRGSSDCEPKVTPNMQKMCKSAYFKSLPSGFEFENRT